MEMIVIQCDPNHLRGFLSLLQEGFFVKVPAGSSIRSLLCTHLGVTEEYVANGIQTVLLDGRPVDDLDAAAPMEGSRLGLSAAMPGLAGAMVRRGSGLAALRESITHKAGETWCRGGTVTVEVRLYNLVMRDLGPLLLSQVIEISQSRFHEFLKRQHQSFWEGVRSVVRDGACLDVLALARGDVAASRGVRLRVISGPEESG